jgi:hypothetical protein
LIRNQTFSEWHGSGKIHSCWIRYEELSRGEGTILDLLKLLGQSFGERQKSLLKELNGRNSSFENAQYQDRWKTLSPFWMATAWVIGGRFNDELGYPNPSTPWWQGLAVRLILFWSRVKGIFQKQANPIWIALQRRFVFTPRSKKSVF